MKIYVIRHQEKFEDNTMFSPLTTKGLENSKKLIDILNKLNINHMFSSPYLKSLQTIYPYSKSNDKEINIEYGLIEALRAPNIPKNSYNMEFPHYLASQFNYNKKYKSQVNREELKYNESDKNIIKRLKRVLSYILKTYGSTKDNILIVSHMLPINAIIQIGAKSKHTNMPKDYPMSYEYPQGALTEIFKDNKWTFNKVNW